MAQRIFCDIDGTLTDSPSKKWGAPRRERIEALRRALASGDTVVVWSGGGTRYAVEFAQRYALRQAGALAIGKPTVIVDDNPEIRPRQRMPIVTPEEFFAGK